MVASQAQLFEKKFPGRKAIYKAVICGTSSSLALDQSKVLRFD